VSGFVGRVEFGKDARVTSLPAGVLTAGLEVFFQGFLTNRTILAQRLWNEPVSSPKSDPEIVGAAYRRWGLRIQNELEGEFCAAIVDPQRREVLLCHDGLGLRPIYFASLPSGVVFGTGVTGVMRQVGDESLDDGFLADYLCTGTHFGDRTVYRRVRRVPAFHVALINGEGARVQVSWSLANVVPVRYSSTAEYDEQFLALLRRAITTRVGKRTLAELSGGLDSSSIVALTLAERLADLDIVSYIYSKSKSADERKWMRPVVEKFPGTTWNQIDLDQWMPFMCFPEHALDQPQRVAVLWGQFVALRDLALTKNADVLLSGFGGDQVLAGDMVAPLHLADFLLQGRLWGAVGAIRAWQSVDATRRPFRYHLMQYVVRPAIRQLARRNLTPDFSASESPWLNPLFIERNRCDPAQFRPVMPSVGGTAYQERVLDAAASTRELWNGLSDDFDIRYPLLDRPLVEFMCAIPWDQKIVPGQDRVLQRRALERVLPAETVSRGNKCGPDESILRGFAKNLDLQCRLKKSPRIAELGYVDGGRWRECVDAMSAERLGATSRFLTAISLELWLQSRDSTLDL
jgi:asparagine synthase (glutamine-hydrolysing)